MDRFLSPVHVPVPVPVAVPVAVLALAFALSSGCGGDAVSDVSEGDANCIPACGTAECGDDGCGGVCGVCDDDFKCRDGACVCGFCGGVCGDCPDMEFVDVTAGTFTMGCVADAATVDKVCSTDERPPHAVNMPAYQAGRYEVTVAQYNACVATGACFAADDDTGCNGPKAGLASHPINCVSWDDAEAYCMWAGARLGSEAEWEYAARGTDGRRYPWGNQGPTCNLAWTAADNCAGPYTMEVGSFPLGDSPFGCADMAGNVSEWVEDPWHDDYNGAPTDGSVWLKADAGAARVHRGGGYNAKIEESRSYNRMSLPRTDRSKYRGIRCFR